jgi:hypothetical protein
VTAFLFSPSRNNTIFISSDELKDGKGTLSFSRIEIIMIKLFTICFLSIPMTVLCQLENFDTTNRDLFRKVVSLTEYGTDKDSSWKKSSYVEFNKNGMPTKMIRYGNSGGESEKQLFIYDAVGKPASDSTYKGGKLFSSTDYNYDLSGKLTSLFESVYASLDGEKLPTRKIFLEYYSNQKLRKKSTLEFGKEDTTNIDFFDSSGFKRESILHESGLRSTKIIYNWNQDRTEMKEAEFENDSSVYNTIVHRYKNNKEIERLDSLTSGLIFYWKYDDKGRMIETNEALYYITYNQYDEAGYVTNRRLHVMYSDSSEEDLPKDIELKYEYVFRK